MKAALLPVACGTALALMAGAATAHFFSVRQSLAIASLLAPTALPATAPKAPDDRTIHAAKQLLAEEKAKDSSPVSRTPAAVAPSIDEARLERLFAALEGMVEQNQELRNQVAETNRDLMALQFQVDSHSQQFRPLNVTEEPMLDSGSGVLPPRQSP